MSHSKMGGRELRLPIFLHYSGIFRIFASVVRLNFSLISFMKIKKFALGLLAVSLFSCTDKGGDITKDTVSVSASLENGRLWESGDEVLINGATYVITDGVGTSLSTIEKVTMSDIYCAAYDFGSGVVDGQTLTFSLPSTQTVGHSLARPMVACNKNPMLSFKYLLGTLKLSFTGESATLTKLVLSTSDGTKLSGDASVSLNFTGSPALDLSENANSTLTIELGDGIEVGGASVEVTLPAGSYSSLMLTAYAKDGNVMTAKSLSAIEVRRGEVADCAVEYVSDDEPPIFLSASLEDGADGSQNKWAQSSVLFVNGLPATLYEGADTGNAKFGPIKAADKYYVSTSSAASGSGSSAIIRTEIPSTQYLEKPISQTNPAAGIASGTEVALKYVGGVISVNLTGAHEIREAELLSKSSVRLSGSGVINLEVSDFALSLNADAKNNVIINCGAGVDATSGAKFNFVVPAGQYGDGFTFIATDSKGQIFSMDIPAISVSRNQSTQAGTFEWASSGAGSNDLSLKGYANCYMVHSEGEYSFATNKVNNSKIGGIESADWLWVSKVGSSSNNELISDVKYADGRISFKASSNKGNALIAAFDKDGNIVWSWHIWMTDMPQVFDYENNPVYQSGGKTNGFFVMDRNLGATGVEGDEAFGLFYQWGRKDPFIGDTENEYLDREDMVVVKRKAFERSDNFVLRNTKYSQANWQTAPCTKEIGSVEYATAHPMLFIYAGEDSHTANWVVKENISYDAWWDEDKSLWTPNEKAVYDPCPVGYQVPKNRTFETLNDCIPEWSDNHGVTFTLSNGVTTWFPYQGYRSAHPQEQGALTYVRMPNGQVHVWTSHYAVKEFAYSFFVSRPVVFNYDNNRPWANGLNVRCVKAY